MIAIITENRGFLVQVISGIGKIGKEKLSMKAIKRVTIVVILQMLMVGIAHGQQFNPPAEAYKACEGKSVGSAAQLINPSGETISGICEEVNG